MDESKKQTRNALIIVFFVIAVGVAIYSASQSLFPHPRVVGTLGADPQNGSGSKGGKQ